MIYYIHVRKNERQREAKASRFFCCLTENDDRPARAAPSPPALLKHQNSLLSGYDFHQELLHPMTQLNPAEQSSADLSPTASDGRVIPDLLDSPEALEAYLADVKRRRELHREQRRRAYWQSAILRLREELEAARAEQDEVIAAELAGVLASFERALTTDAPADMNVQPLPSAAEQNPEATPTPAANEISTLKQNAASSNGMHTNGSLTQVDAPASKAPPAVTLPANEAARAELALRCQDLRGEIREHLTASADDLTHALRSRALFCDGQALALNPDTPDAGKQALTDPIDDRMPL